MQTHVTKFLKCAVNDYIGSSINGTIESLFLTSHSQFLGPKQWLISIFYGGKKSTFLPYHVKRTILHFFRKEFLRLFRKFIKGNY